MCACVRAWRPCVQAGPYRKSPDRDRSATSKPPHSPPSPSPLLSTALTSAMMAAAVRPPAPNWTVRITGRSTGREPGGSEYVVRFSGAGSSPFVARSAAPLSAARSLDARSTHVDECCVVGGVSDVRARARARRGDVLDRVALLAFRLAGPGGACSLGQSAF